MPLYEYQCSKCNEVFEVLQRFSDAPLKLHEGCGGKVARLLTAPSFQFKGSGFYITDYANKHSSSPSHDSNGSDNGSNSNSAKPSESKSTPSAAAPASSSTPAASASDK